LFHSLTALWAPGPGQDTRLAAGVTRPYVFVAGSVSVNADTSAIPKPRVSRAKYALLPSLETENEWSPEPLLLPKPWGPVNRRIGACPVRTGEMS
jgi:hypothetical protein